METHTNCYLDNKCLKRLVLRKRCENWRANFRRVRQQDFMSVKIYFECAKVTWVRTVSWLFTVLQCLFSPHKTGKKMFTLLSGEKIWNETLLYGKSYFNLLCIMRCFQVCSTEVSYKIVTLSMSTNCIYRVLLWPCVRLKFSLFQYLVDTNLYFTAITSVNQSMYTILQKRTRKIFS